MYRGSTILRDTSTLSALMTQRHRHAITEVPTRPQARQRFSTYHDHLILPHCLRVDSNDLVHGPPSSRVAHMAESERDLYSGDTASGAQSSDRSAHTGESRPHATYREESSHTQYGDDSSPLGRRGLPWLSWGRLDLAADATSVSK